MNILVLDCAYLPTVQIVLNNKKVVQKVSENERSCDNFMAFIDEALKEANLTLDDIQVIAINKGPGSFTGLRVSASIAKAFGFGKDVKYKTYTSFDYIEALKDEAIVMVGFSNFVYVKYPSGKMECEAISSLDKNQKYVVCHQGLFVILKRAGLNATYREKRTIDKIMSDSFVDASPASLEPLYLRKSQAELQRESKQTKK